MIVFDRDVDAFAESGYERWMVYDDALPDSAAVICRGISKREDASFIAECFENRAANAALAYTCGCALLPYKTCPRHGDGSTARFPERATEVRDVVAGQKPTPVVYGATPYMTDAELLEAADGLLPGTYSKKESAS